MTSTKEPIFAVWFVEHQQATHWLVTGKTDLEGYVFVPKPNLQLLATIFVLLWPLRVVFPLTAQ